ncbi:universal stress protein [Legionella longbeachae]|uniref:Universal stress protein n=1 Tax=Legionella longbeachae serogroup 1 (strain NSW150) TaxID=661367 RepID=D3HK84_LEGLN|nr:universal stress protein [Legionella longbeachae]VEE03365.1 universal stress protein [Legionella oakridgensis]HBD7397642.1 universal stress protein [Legionella pneumophila]ARB93739.1 universal stress protein [Legionella longbeachae]ARM33121.1 universal stress protein [Legionella longbeachae]EEZ94037.1 universal stress family protein [Legionella longbeachae D-4968]
MYKQIMIAVDGSKASSLALKEAIELAKNQNSKLCVIHIVDTLYEGDVDREAFVELIRKQGQEVLNSIKKKLSRVKIEFEMKLTELTPSKSQIAEKLVDEASAWSADLIIIGTHGRRGIQHILTGSVAEEVIRISKIPVLLVKK